MKGSLELSRTSTGSRDAETDQIWRTGQCKNNEWPATFINFADLLQK